MKNVIIETADKRLKEFLHRNEEAYEMSKGKAVYITAINTDTFYSIFRELDKHVPPRYSKESVMNLLSQRIATDAAILDLLKFNNNIYFALSPSTAVAIKGLNCYVALSAFSIELNHKFLTEILMENNQLTEEMRVANHRALLVDLQFDQTLETSYR